MPQQITTAFGKLIAAIRGFSLAQRTLALIGLAILAVVLVTAGTWMSKPQMRALYTDLAPADASAIVEILTTDGVPYELTNGGGTIMVPADQVYAERLKVASSGLTPVSHAGYSLLDNMGMTTSEFQQNVTYKRALEGELAATLGAMTGVETASVQLALPEESVFVSAKQDPSASVFIKPRSGANFNDDQVMAMVQLVSSSIEGMDTKDVSVIDANGTVLSAPGVNNGPRAASKAATEYEERISQNVQGMLDRIVGPGNAVVSVTAELDQDATERTSESFTSNEDAEPLTERTTTEEFNGANNNATGVLGPDNIAVPNGEGDGNYTNTSTERNNAVDKITEHTVTTPGTVRKQSVSIAVDQEAAGGLNMAELSAMVASAAGIDEARGDVVSVTRMRFDQSAANAATAAIAEAEAANALAARQASFKTMITGAVIAVLAIVLISAIMISRRRRQNTIMANQLIELDEISSEADAFAAIGAGQLLDELDGLPEIPQLPASPNQAALEAEQKRQDVVALADENPEQVATFIRELMDVRGN